MSAFGPKVRRHSIIGCEEASETTAIHEVGHFRKPSRSALLATTEQTDRKWLMRREELLPMRAKLTALAVVQIPVPIGAQHHPATPIRARSKHTLWARREQ